MTKVVAEIAKQITEKSGGNGNGKPAQVPMVVTPGQITGAAPAPAEVKKEMTLNDKILKVENLKLLIEKRQKLVETMQMLERFQIGSNDFNCSMRLTDSDGNVFTTSFTPGIKKVVDFLKKSFETSISEAEEKIVF